MKITYTKHGDYYLPDLTLPEQSDRPIGIWGQRHRNYLRDVHRVQYYNLLTSGELHDYLADIDEQADKRFNFLVKQLAERENVTEKLKAESQMEWVAKMNNIHNRAREIVNSEIIYT